MKVSELFERLATGPLSNLALSEEKEGVINPSYNMKLINYTNAALLALYARFILKTRTVLIESKAHITDYELKSKYAQTNPKCRDPYIIDYPHDRFNDDAIKIVGVTAQGRGRLPLNDRNDSRSMFTPQPLTLQVPNPVEGDSLSVSYQARHEPIVMGKKPEDILNDCLDIPFFLEDALINFIASEYYTHLNGEENLATGAVYYSKFDRTCIEIQDKDLNNETLTTTSHKFHERGYV